jgi:hypothetical protein
MVQLISGTSSTIHSNESTTEAVIPSTTVTAFSSLSLNAAESGRKFVNKSKPTGICSKILSRSGKDGEDSGLFLNFTLITYA